MGLLPNFAAKRPHVAEHDLAGVIVDQKDTDLKVGEEVFGWIPVRELCLTHTPTNDAEPSSLHSRTAKD